jgi:hypothetical protein
MVKQTGEELTVVYRIRRILSFIVLLLIYLLRSVYTCCLLSKNDI